MNKETLDEIRKHAYVQLSPYEVEIQCGLEDGVIAKSDEATRAWWEGRTQGITNIRATLMQQARDGNVQAAREMSKYADEVNPENEE